LASRRRVLKLGFGLGDKLKTEGRGQVAPRFMNYFTRTFIACDCAIYNC
jgi:hypothetical protein